MVANATNSADFFERKIRPTFVAHCYECHGGDEANIQGGLRLDDPTAMRRGGETGQVIKPGDIEGSALLAALRYDDLKMPPEGKLPEHVIRDFEIWIAAGATDPRTSRKARRKQLNSTGKKSDPDGPFNHPRAMLVPRQKIQSGARPQWMLSY